MPSERALFRRLQRDYAKNGCVLRRNSGGPYSDQHLNFIVVDGNSHICDQFENLEERAKELGLWSTDQDWMGASERLAAEANATLDLSVNAKDVIGAVEVVLCGLDDGGYENSEYSHQQMVEAHQDLECARSHLEYFLNRIPDVLQLGDSSGEKRTIDQWLAEVTIGELDDMTQDSTVTLKLPGIEGEFQRRNAFAWRHGKLGNSKEYQHPVISFDSATRKYSIFENGQIPTGHQCIWDAVDGDVR